MIYKLTDKTEFNTFQKVVDIHRLCISQSNAANYPSELIEEWLKEVNIEDTINQLKYTTWITLEKDNNVVGFAQYSLPDAELYQIQIDPSIQRKGYGKELYEYIEKDFKANNLREMALYSVQNAVEFYKKLGFKKKKGLLFPLKKTKTELTVMKKRLR
jgi:ribosomal protein S18 acetylase RimI-like enzyme